MRFKKNTVKTSKSEPRLSGYAVGAGIRKAIEGKLDRPGTRLTLFSTRLGYEPPRL